MSSGDSKVLCHVCQQVDGLGKKCDVCHLPVCDSCFKECEACKKKRVCMECVGMTWCQTDYCLCCCCFNYHCQCPCRGAPEEKDEEVRCLSVCEKTLDSEQTYVGDADDLELCGYCSSCANVARQSEEPR